ATWSIRSRRCPRKRGRLAPGASAAADVKDADAKGTGPPGGKSPASDRSRRWLFVVAPALRVTPQHAVLPANVAIELLAEALGKIVRADQRDHVGEVLQAVGSVHPARELQLDECRQREDR